MNLRVWVAGLLPGVQGPLPIARRLPADGQAPPKGGPGPPSGTGPSRTPRTGCRSSCSARGALGRLDGLHPAQAVEFLRAFGRRPPVRWAWAALRAPAHFARASVTAVIVVIRDISTSSTAA